MLMDYYSLLPNFLFTLFYFCCHFFLKTTYFNQVTVYKYDPVEGSITLRLHLI